MSNNQFNLYYETELNEGVRVITLSPAFFSDDDEAHSFIVRTTRDGKPESLTGATVRGYFIRPDNATIVLEGSVDEEGHAVVTLDAACYAKKGRFQLVIRATMDDVISTIFCGDGGVKPSSTDTIVDEENIIPSLDELLAQIATIEGAVDSANAAANNANTAANSANNAAERAETAAEKAENAQGPTGATGATPNLTIGTVQTLSAGSNATATITGTTENPVLNLGIPRGADGADGADGVDGEDGVDGTGSTVSFTRSLTSGTKVGTITINGTSYDLYAPTDTNTTYSAGAGISLSGTTFSNSGVRSVATGSTNGTISVNTNGTSAEVAVNGLGSAAYTASSAYAASSHTHSNYLSTSGTAYSSARLASDAIILQSTVTTVSLSANGYLSQQTITPTAVSGYTLIAPVHLSSNSSYTLCYHLYYAAGKLGFSVRNLSSNAVEATITIYCLYVKTA